MDLQDFVTLYRDETVRKDEIEKQLEQERTLELEQFVRDQLERLDLKPKRIVGQCAFFDHDGREIQIVIWRAKYSVPMFVIVHSEKCPNCDEQFASSAHELEPYSIGSVIANSERRYHDCSNPTRSSNNVPARTPREVLLDALDDYIAAGIGAYPRE